MRVYVVWLRLETDEQRAPYALRLFRSLEDASRHAEDNAPRAVQTTGHDLEEEPQMEREKSCLRCRRAMDQAREFCPRCGEAYQPNSGSDPEHRWPY